MCFINKIQFVNRNKVARESISFQSYKDLELK